MAVLQAGERPFGLVVEAVHDTEEIVVKPLSKQLKGIPLFAGATIMGDGRVVLILDILGLAQRAGVVSEVRGRTGRRPPPSPRRRTTGADPRAVPAERRPAHGRSAVLGGAAGRVSGGSGRTNGQPGSGAISRPHPVRWFGWIRCFLARARRVGGAGVPCRSSSFPHAAGASGWWSIASSTWWKPRPRCSAGTQRDGVLGSVVLQQRVTDLLDVHAVLRVADATLPEQPALA